MKYLGVFILGGALGSGATLVYKTTEVRILQRSIEYQDKIVELAMSQARLGDITAQELLEKNEFLLSSLRAANEVQDCTLEAWKGAAVKTRKHGSIGGD